LGTRRFDRNPIINPGMSPALGENINVALDVNGAVLSVCHSRIGDAPESILMSTIELTDEWRRWRASEPVVVLEPHFDYEGAALPLRPSGKGRNPSTIRRGR
jgi:hypothetical protein